MSAEISLDLCHPFAVTWPDEWSEMLETFGYVATTRASRHADRDPALLAEGLPYPEHDLGPWDTTERIARMMAPELYGGRYGWGVLLLVSRGAKTIRESVARQEARRRLEAERLLDAIFAQGD